MNLAMPLRSPRVAIVVLFLFLWAASAASAAENLIFITWDGFRWQEFFGGAEEALINKDAGGVPEVGETKRAFLADTPEARREKLLPFVWSVVAKQGQIFGDPAKKSPAKVTNGMKFSYPGYNEMFVGYPNPAIISNAKVNNPNVNVLEHLHRQKEFAGKVAAFATWDVMEFILNRERSGMIVHCGWLPLRDEPLSPGQKQVNDLVRDLPRLWRGNCFDAITHTAAKEHLVKHKPRVLYIGLGETDEWAHAKRYDLYLEAAQRSDRQLKELWEILQSEPQYKEKTTVILTTDHGRGTGKLWTNHSPTTEGAEYVWMAALGAEVPPLGVREGVETTQSQIAATLAAAVGVDYQKAYPQAASPLPLRP